jgi:high affinity sulfate transporter 1
MSAVETPAQTYGTLARAVPALAWLRAYQPEWLRFDLVAGLTTAALVIPQAMAYATLAGLPVQAGLYTALAAMPIYALLGTSRPLSVSVSSTVSILTASALAGVPPERVPAAAALLALMFGAAMLLAGLLRLGFLAEFISQPVLVGFKTGAGLFIASGQLGKILGVSVPGGDFFEQVAGAVARVPAAHLPTLVLGLGSIALLLALRRWAPRVPGPLVVVVLGIAAAQGLGLAAQGVAVIGPIPPGLPTPVLPELADARGLLWAALGIALMSSIDSIGAARAFATREEPRIDANRELVAVGAAALGAGLLHGYPPDGGMSQTAVNRAAGARTQVAQLITAGMVLLTLTLLTPLFENLPQASLGALVLVAVAGLVDVKAMRRIGLVRRRDLLLSLVAAAGVLVVGILDGVLIAVLVSMLVLLFETNTQPVELLGREPGTQRWRALTPAQPGETVPGLVVVRAQGRLYFANAQRVTDHVLVLAEGVSPPVRVVVFDASVIPDLEFTALQALAGLNQELHARGAALWLAGLHRVPREMVQRALALYEGPSGRLCDDVEAAVAAFEHES